ncbi:MAG: signal transduction protein [Chloroflexi bacterium OLB15]|nr:MAG: signal transduction protein [Chloroflexi bacterium OLB15]
MLRETKVRQCMTSPAISVTPNTTLHEAKKIMLEHHIRHLPVVKNQELVGILSSGDVRRASPSDATSLSVWELNYLWEQILVESSMTTKVISVHPDTPVLEAARLLAEHRFGCLPVVDANKHLQGILTEIDILRLVIQYMENAERPYADTVDEGWAAPSL